MTALRRCDEWSGGLSWVVDETMERASHALVDDGRVWLVDPVDVPEALERAAALGTITAVVQLLDRHGRDGEVIARRFGAAHLRLPAVVPDSPLQSVPVLRLPRWQERALWWPGQRALVVAEALGSAPYFALGAPVGVHPMLRLRPPGALRPFEPEHVLFGHGAGVHGPGAAPAVRRAYARSVRDLPRLITKLPALVR